jgi:hypothetical protein
MSPLAVGAGLGAGVVLAGWLGACSGERTSHALPRPVDDTPDVDPGDGGSPDGPPDLDADGLCGNQIHQAIANAPNIYFVLDTSGSMADDAPGGTRFGVVRTATLEVIRSLGPLINVGLALFPYEPTQEDPCHRGQQVLSVKPGDPKTGEDGPTTLAFVSATAVEPNGGTPTAETLANLLPDLQALEGETIVVLATDGGPNCNFDAACGQDDCTINIEGICPWAVNCCDPDYYGPVSCLDRAATLSAIADIADAGIDVYVVGIPGSLPYAGLLGQMAIVGGGATGSAPFYHQVEDLSTLEDVFRDIASVVISCEFDLVDPPLEPGFTNVYLDTELLPLDPDDGWGWKTDSVVELYGAACARLKAGEVGQVQIVSGCPTETPK